jgi:hypothetical protein
MHRAKKMSDFNFVHRAMKMSDFNRPPLPAPRHLQRAALVDAASGRRFTLAVDRATGCASRGKVIFFYL